MERSDKAFLLIIVLGVAAVGAYTSWLFLDQETYNFVVEAPCDPSAQTCFVRDCSEGDCPPNGLETYQVFLVKARDFKTCADDSCLTECTSGTINCQTQVCGEAEEDSCSTQDEPLEDTE